MVVKTLQGELSSRTDETTVQIESSLTTEPRLEAGAAVRCPLTLFSAFLQEQDSTWTVGPDLAH